MAMDSLRNSEQMVGYARSKGAPFPEIPVPAVSGPLLSGGVGIALWRYPRAAAAAAATFFVAAVVQRVRRGHDRAAAAAAATFFVSVTPVMQDFWNLDDPEQRQQQMIHLLKNVALLGATLATFALGREE